MRFLVKKGRHNRLSLPSIHFGIKYLKFRIFFDKNCYYPVLDTDDYDLNKGYGWTYGRVHDDSIRVCWRPDEKEAQTIQLYTYIYNKSRYKKISWSSAFVTTDEWNIFGQLNRIAKRVFYISLSRIRHFKKKGVRVMNYITTIKTGEWYEIEIKVTEPLNTIAFTVRDNSDLFLASTGEKFTMPKFRWGYFLDLFMGGTKPARQDTSMWIERI